MTANPCLVTLRRPTRAGREQPVRVVELRVEAVALDWKGEPVVVLREVEGQRAVFIWVGVIEVSAITLPLDKQTPPRPLTHDLIMRILDQLQAEVTRVVISDVREVTYYATLELCAGGVTCAIDCRPVDGLAVALRANAPVFIEAELLERLGTVAQDPGITIVNPGEPTVH